MSVRCCFGFLWRPPILSLNKKAGEIQWFHLETAGFQICQSDFRSSGASGLKSYFYFHQLAVWDAWWVWGGDLFGPYVSRGAASGSQLVEIDFTNGFNSFHKREMLLTVFNRIPEHLCIPVSIQSVILPVIGRTLFCLRKVPNVSSCLSLVAELLTSQGKL